MILSFTTWKLGLEYNPVCWGVFHTSRRRSIADLNYISRACQTRGDYYDGFQSFYRHSLKPSNSSGYHPLVTLVTIVPPNCLQSGTTVSLLSQAAMDTTTDDTTPPRRQRPGIHPERRIPSPGGFTGPPLPGCCELTILSAILMTEQMNYLDLFPIMQFGFVDYQHASTLNDRIEQNWIFFYHLLCCKWNKYEP